MAMKFASALAVIAALATALSVLIAVLAGTLLTSYI